MILEDCFSREGTRMEGLIKRLLQYWGGLVMVWTWGLELHLIYFCPRCLSLADVELLWLSWSHPRQMAFLSMGYGKGRVGKRVLCPLEPSPLTAVIIGSVDIFSLFSGTRVFPGGPYIPKTFTLKNSDFYIWNTWVQAPPHMCEVSRLGLKIHLIVLVLFLLK